MAEGSDVGLFLVLVVITEGVWLAGLTYLMWRSHMKRKRAEQSPPEEGDAKGTA